MFDIYFENVLRRNNETFDDGHLGLNMTIKKSSIIKNIFVSVLKMV